MRRRDFLAGGAAFAGGRALAQAPADIFAAIRAQDTSSIVRLLDGDPTLLRAKDAGGATPLLASAFIRRGVAFIRPEDSPPFGVIAPRVKEPDLFEACLLKRFDVVEPAIARDARTARLATPNGRTLLHYAAYVGDIRLMDALLDRGALIDAGAAGVFNSPPILQTILGRRRAALERLIARGANVNIRLSDGSTPMHEAALLGRDDLVGMLARSGAKPDAVRDDGRKPRDLAAAQGHLRTATLLDQLAVAAGSG